MRKLINGEYVSVRDVPEAKGHTVIPAAGLVASKAAAALIAANAEVDFSPLQGTGYQGQITKPDVEKFLASQAK